MRLWCVDPSKMCRKHLLDEHLAVHTLIGRVVKNLTMTGYIQKGLVEVHNLVSRHDQIVAEFVVRGWKHNTPLTEEVLDKLKAAASAGVVDVAASIRTLSERCEECRKLLGETG